MKKHVFTSTQKFALWKHHGQKCLLCHEPLRLGETTGDHVVPEYLLEKPDELANIKKTLGLPDSFPINDYPNWIPSHIQCNQRKSSSIFRPTPLIQILLDRLQRDSDKVRAIESRVISNVAKDKLLNAVMAGLQQGTITQDDLERLFPIPGTAADEDILTLYDEVCLHVDPRRWRIVAMSGQLATVTDGKLTGMTPAWDNPDISWHCPYCGSIGPWDGVRCMTCGQISDPND